jgi:hypothetical protein
MHMKDPTDPHRRPSTFLDHPGMEESEELKCNFRTDADEKIRFNARVRQFVIDMHADAVRLGNKTGGISAVEAQIIVDKSRKAFANYGSYEDAMTKVMDIWYEDRA